MSNNNELKYTEEQFKNIIFNQMSKEMYQKLLKEGKVKEGEFYITNDAFKDHAGGMDILDIGQSIFIDESQGLRRWCNGSWLSINDNTIKFYEKLMQASMQDTSLCISNEEYETQLTENDGECRKFVIDNGNSRIRLPKLKGNYFIQIATGLETVIDIESNIKSNNPYTLGESKYSPITLNNASWLSADIKDNLKSAYPSYFNLLVDILREKKRVDGITVKEVGDETITRLDHVVDLENEKFNLPSLNGTEDTMPNGSGENKLIWKEQLTESGTLFTAPYNGWLFIEFPYEENKYVNVYNQTRTMGDYQCASSAGNSITAKMWCNKDDIIGVYYNFTAVVHRLEFHIATKPGKLYYYIGDSNQDSNLVNSGKLGDIVLRDNQFYVVESWRNGRNWFRKYSDGWCEQGGWIALVAGNVAWKDTKVNLHTPFIDTNYMCTTFGAGVSDGHYGTNGYPKNITTTSFTMTVYNTAGGTVPWYACGYWK